MTAFENCKHYSPLLEHLSKPLLLGLQGVLKSRLWQKLLVVVAALLSVFAIMSATGCTRPTVIVDQGSPMIIIGASGSATMAAWDPDFRELRIIGTIDAKELEGLTVVAFDWSVYEQDEDAAAAGMDDPGEDSTGEDEEDSDPDTIGLSLPDLELYRAVHLRSGGPNMGGPSTA